jgi:hypothetical protein
MRKAGLQTYVRFDVRRRGRSVLAVAIRRLEPLGRMNKGSQDRGRGEVRALGIVSVHARPRG